MQRHLQPLKRQQLALAGAVACLLVAFAAATPAAADDPQLTSLRPVPGFQVYPTTDVAAEMASARASEQAPLRYHGGPVMRFVNAYVIFWDPQGMLSDTYKSLVLRYFQDVNGSDFYRILGQYYMLHFDEPLRFQKWYITSYSALGGVWQDRTPYPHAGSPDDPITNFDIQQSIARAIDRNAWRGGLQSLFFVFTGRGIESCFLFVFCTPGTEHSTYCAYHSSFLHRGQVVVYANMPFAETWGRHCRAFDVSPNGDLAADSVISIASHEHFEAVTDPVFLGWWDSGLQEVADKCAYEYGAIGPDGSNLSLRGRPYILQLEWSNAQTGCVKGPP